MSDNNSPLLNFLAVVLHQNGGSIEVPKGNIDAFSQSVENWTIVQGHTESGAVKFSLDTKHKCPECPEEFMPPEMPVIDQYIEV